MPAKDGLVFLLILSNAAYLTCTPVNDLPALIPSTAPNGVPSAPYFQPGANKFNNQNREELNAIKREAQKKYGLANTPTSSQTSMSVYPPDSGSRSIARNKGSSLSKKAPAPAQPVPRTYCQIVTVNERTNQEQCCLNSNWELHQADFFKDDYTYYITNYWKVQCTDDDSNGMTVHKPWDLSPAFKKKEYRCQFLYKDSATNDLRCCQNIEFKQITRDVLGVWRCHDDEFTDSCDWYVKDKSNQIAVNAPETHIVSSASSLKPAIFVIGLAKPEILVLSMFLYALPMVVNIFAKAKSRICKQYNNIDLRGYNQRLIKAPPMDMLGQVTSIRNDKVIWSGASQPGQSSAIQDQRPKKANISDGTIQKPTIGSTRPSKWTKDSPNAAQERTQTFETKGKSKIQD